MDNCIAQQARNNFFGASPRNNSQDSALVDHLVVKCKRAETALERCNYENHMLRALLEAAQKDQIQSQLQRNYLLTQIGTLQGQLAALQQAKTAFRNTSPFGENSSRSGLFGSIFAIISCY